jgi:cell division protein FtsQ
MIITNLDTMTGRQLREINLEEIEELIRKNHYLRQADASITVNGVLKISAIQRKPSLRMISEDLSCWYIDEEGVIMPVKTGYAAYVPILSSNRGFPGKNMISSGENVHSLDLEQVEHALLLCNYLKKNDFANALIDQVVLSESGEFELIPKIFGPAIILGSIDNIDRKFEDLFWIYKKVLPEKGWEYYKKIYLKYENQVVCSK